MNDDDFPQQLSLDTLAVRAGHQRSAEQDCLSAL